MDKKSGITVILYDGVCGLCNRLNVFVLERDRKDVFYFASLQSSTAKDILARHGKDPADLDTVYVVLDCARPSERLFMRSTAILEILSRLDGFWPMTAKVVKWIPAPIRDFGYGLVARTRYSIFGKYDSCRMPEKHWKDKFLDV